MYRRKNGFLYRSKRVGRKVRTEYIGDGVIAELLQYDQMKADFEKQLERAKLAEEAREYQVIEDQLSVLSAAVDDLAAAALLLAGNHQHHGTWRRNGRTSQA